MDLLSLLVAGFKHFSSIALSLFLYAFSQSADDEVVLFVTLAVGTGLGIVGVVVVGLAEGVEELCVSLKTLSNFDGDADSEGEANDVVPLFVATLSVPLNRLIVKTIANPAKLDEMARFLMFFRALNF